MGELTASAALWMIRGLGLSPTVQIVSMAAVFCARPLLRWFFEWLGGSDQAGALASVEREPVPVLPMEPGDDDVSVDQLVPDIGAAEVSRGPNRIGCCDVY